MQQLLPTFKPTEADLAERAMALPLEDKIRNAIGLLQLHEPMAKRISPDGYWLAFSGGKDSCVIKELARMAGVAFLPVYNVTTIDPPELVRFIKREHPDVPSKSGLMLGVGETLDEVEQVMRDMRAHDVEMLTLGQYLQPSKHHLPVERFVHPDEFEQLRLLGESLGFSQVASGPMVRSSYHADRQAAGLV